MSYMNYDKAMKLASKCDDYYVGNGKNKEIIRKAEELLNLKFSKQIIEYLSNYGFIEFFGNEIYGIVKDDFSGMPEGNIVEGALYYRKYNNLSNEWLPIYNFGNGYIGYLDFENLNKDEEPRVIMATYNGNNYVNVKIIADDFGDFLLSCVNNQLSHQ